MKNIENNQNIKINGYAEKILSLIKKCVSEELQKQVQLITAIVHSVNDNGTVNIYLPEKINMIYTNISNHTPFLLQPGDGVELLIKDGSYSNCWIIAKHGDTFTGSLSNMGLEYFDYAQAQSFSDKMQSYGFLQATSKNADIKYIEVDYTIVYEEWEEITEAEFLPFSFKIEIPVSAVGGNFKQVQLVNNDPQLVTKFGIQLVKYDQGSVTLCCLNRPPQDEIIIKLAYAY